MAITADASRTARWAASLALAALPLSLLSGPATAVPYNRATYSVTLTAVQAPNQAPGFVPGASQTMTSAQYNGDPAPSTVQVAGTANTGTNMAGLGYASGFGFARAEAGVLRATVGTEAQAVARPETAVGAGASAEAVARFSDLATFTSGVPVYQNLLIISGTLNLTGTMTGQGFGEIHVGGTGLNANNSQAEWVADNNGRIKTAAGVYSEGWVPGTPVSIPFSFTAYSGQATTLEYWLTAKAASGASFLPCAASGGLCNVVELSQTAITVDYGHTLSWGGVSATDWFGQPVSFSASAISGFDYANAAPVPEPAAALMMLAGLAALIAVIHRRR